MRERAFVPVLLFVGTVVSVISSLGAPLIPTIALDMHASIGGAQWALTATLLVGAVASPIIGRLGDGPHRKAVIVGCLVSVTLGGALAALAGALWVLVLGRALQGMGLALLPLTMAAARDHLATVHAGRVIAMLSVVTAVGIGLGYPITGLIAEHADTAVAFWFGAMITGLAMALAAVFLPAGDRDGPHAGEALDVRGALLIAVGLLGLLLGLEKGPDWGWTAPATLGLIALAAVVLAVWVRHELAAEAPLVDLRLVRHRAVLTADVAGLMLGVAMYMGIALITQFVQVAPGGGYGLGESVFVAGLTLLPLSAASFGASRLLPGLQRRVGLQPVIPVGALMVGAGSLFFAATAGLWQAFVTLGIVGVGLGLTFAAMPGLIVSATPRSETGSAMGFYQVSRYVGFSIGSGLSVTLLRAFSDGGPPTLGAYRATFAVAAALCAVTALATWLLPGRLSAPPPDAKLARLEMEEGIAGAAGLETLEERE